MPERQAKLVVRIDRQMGRSLTLRVPKQRSSPNIDTQRTPAWRAIPEVGVDVRGCRGFSAGMFPLQCLKSPLNQPNGQLVPFQMFTPPSLRILVDKSTTAIVPRGLSVAVH